MKEIKRYFDYTMTKLEPVEGGSFVLYCDHLEIVENLAAENERLREALEAIRDSAGSHTVGINAMADPHSFAGIYFKARAALSPQATGGGE